jgi:hypothetical protein
MFPMLARPARDGRPPLIRDVCPACNVLKTRPASHWRLNRKTRILMLALRCECSEWWGVEIPVTSDGEVQLRTLRETVSLASDHLGFRGPIANGLVVGFWALGRAIILIQKSVQKRY